jgi:hypothetical protein
MPAFPLPIDPGSRSPTEMAGGSPTPPRPLHRSVGGGPIHVSDCRHTSGPDSGCPTPHCRIAGILERCSKPSPAPETPDSVYATGPQISPMMHLYCMAIRLSYERFVQLMLAIPHVCRGPVAHVPRVGKGSLSAFTDRAGSQRRNLIRASQQFTDTAAGCAIGALCVAKCLRMRPVFRVLFHVRRSAVLAGRFVRSRHAVAFRRTGVDSLAPARRAVARPPLQPGSRIGSDAPPAPSREVTTN